MRDARVVTWADFTRAADAILDAAVRGAGVGAAGASGSASVPGVIALVTDRTGTIYEGARGVRVVGGDPMTMDTVVALYSATKAITATAAVRLAERGVLDLDREASAYAPYLGEVEVVVSLDPDGSPRLRPPRTIPTTRHLLTHTAGFGYDFTNRTYAALARAGRQPPIAVATRAALTTPLLADPGTRWEYGSNLDWVGQVIEGATGRRLGAVLTEEVLGPLGMTDTAFVLDGDRARRAATVHHRLPDGTARPARAGLPTHPEIDMGGHGLFGTVPDYGRFLRFWLGDGAPLLSARAHADALADHLPPGCRVTPVQGTDARLCTELDLFPGVATSWSLPFLRTDEPIPAGPAAGSLGWAGLANLYYWIDRESGIAGLWATQILPLGDPAAVAGFRAFQAAVYAARPGPPAPPSVPEGAGLRTKRPVDGPLL